MPTTSSQRYGRCSVTAPSAMQQVSDCSSCSTCSGRKRHRELPQYKGGCGPSSSDACMRPWRLCRRLSRCQRRRFASAGPEVFSKVPAPAWRGRAGATTKTWRCVTYQHSMAGEAVAAAGYRCTSCCQPLPLAQRPRASIPIIYYEIISEIILI